MSQAREQVLQILSTSDDAIDFRTAREVCPATVLTDTDPNRYLRVTDGNVEESAKQIACYWRKRREIFGDDKFTLPLRLVDSNWNDKDTTRNGTSKDKEQVVDAYEGSDSATSCFHPAVSRMFARMENEENILGASYYLLPRPKTGETVWFATRGRLPNKKRTERLELTIDLEKQYFFWNLHLASFHHSPDMICVYAILERKPQLHLTAHQALVDLGRNAFGLRTKRLHILVAASSQTRKAIMDAFLPMFMRFTAPLGIPEMTVDVVVADSRSEERDEMTRLIVEKYGLDPRSIPATFGGNWDYARAMEFHETGQIAPLDNNKEEEECDRETPSSRSALDLLAEAAAVVSKAEEPLNTEGASKSKRVRM